MTTDIRPGDWIRVGPRVVIAESGIVDHYGAAAVRTSGGTFLLAGIDEVRRQADPSLLLITKEQAEQALKAAHIAGRNKERAESFTDHPGAWHLADPLRKKDADGMAEARRLLGLDLEKGEDRS